MDATIYMRDIRNLTGTRSEEIIIFGGASTYNKYENSDFAFVKGLVFSYKKNFLNGISVTLDYTFQQAKGTASDPFDAHNATINNASGGDAAAAGFTISTGGSTVLAFSFTGGTLSPGSGI